MLKHFSIILLVSAFMLIGAGCITTDSQQTQPEGTDQIGDEAYQEISDIIQDSEAALRPSEIQVNDVNQFGFSRNQSGLSSCRDYSWFAGHRCRHPADDLLHLAQRAIVDP